MKIAIFLFSFFTLFVSASVIGIDFGSDNFKISLIRPGKKLVIVENEHSKRATPSVIAFTDNGRMFGETAYKEQSKKPELAISFSQRLLGVPFSDSEARENFMTTYQPIELYEDENRTSISYRIKGLDLSNEEVVVMLLEHAKKMTERFGEGHVKDCAITVPSFWTRAQRLALIYAAYGAGLNVLSLINENTAAAFYYAIDRLDNSTVHHALFYNLGASYLQVAVAEYSVVEKNFGTVNKQIETVRILSHASDKYLGGTLLDKLITEHLAKEFETVTGLNARESNKSMMRLFQQSKSVKKTLSASKLTPVTVNNLYKEKDLKATLTRETFEEMLAPYIDRLVAPVNKALESAGLTIEQIDSFELIGGVSRVPKVQEVLKERLKVELGTHLNGDEAMAHGAAIFAANSSSVVHVKPLWLSDILLYKVTAKYFSEGSTEAFKEEELFPVGSTLRAAARNIFTHNQNIKVLLQIQYEDKVVDATSYEIEGIHDLYEKSGKDPDLMFVFAVDSSGLPFLYEAYSKYEADVIKKVPKPKEKKETETVKEEESENKEEVVVDESEKSAEEATTKAEETQDAKDTIEYEEVTTKETKEIKLEFTQTDLELPKILAAEQIHELMTRVGSFKLKEDEMKKLAEVKNDLEAYVYYMREKLEETTFVGVTQEEERENYSKSVGEAHDWMETNEYSSANSTEIKQKKKDLEKEFEDALEREKESEIRDQVISEALAQITKLEEKLVSVNATKPWIPADDMKIGWTRINETRAWINEKVKEQKGQQPWEALSFKTSEITTKVDLIAKQVEKLQRMTKPKPKTPEFMNFGKDFDWSKFKMENVTVNGENINTESGNDKPESEDNAKDSEPDTEEPKVENEEAKSEEGTQEDLKSGEAEEAQKPTEEVKIDSEDRSKEDHKSDL